MSSTKNKIFNSRAKLMITGEYAVLKGAISLALPLRFGQKLTITETEGTPSMIWKSMVNNGLWFYSELLLPDFQLVRTNNTDLSQTLQKTLKIAKALNPRFLASTRLIQATSVMNFDPAWGIGSSSSFISNVAYWADCDPFILNNKLFNGSGTDIACARSMSPIIFELKNEKAEYRKANFYPPFSKQLYFIYLNRKQNSRESIQKMDLQNITAKEIQLISTITLEMEKAAELKTFQQLADEHEAILGGIIQEIPVKTRHFFDFDGSVKSLGGWGGDFIMVASAASEAYVRNYFKKKHLNIIFRYDEIVFDVRSTALIG
jgi:mevalonate kinase